MTIKEPKQQIKEFNNSSKKFVAEKEESGIANSNKINTTLKIGFRISLKYIFLDKDIRGYTIQTLTN